jgi:hypothetical protein
MLMQRMYSNMKDIWEIYKNYSSIRDHFGIPVYKIVYFLTLMLEETLE